MSAVYRITVNRGGRTHILRDRFQATAQQAHDAFIEETTRFRTLHNITTLEAALQQWKTGDTWETVLQIGV